MNTPTRYRKRPIAIQAVQFDGTNTDQIAEWTDGMFGSVYPDDRTDDPEIVATVFDQLHSTWVGVKKGDWIIRGIQGEFYPCDADVFAQTYEPDPQSQEQEQR